MANYKEEQKQRARELYFTTGNRQSTIAKDVGVCERTISVWVNEGNWKMLKKMKYHAPQVEMHQLYEELRTISVNIAKRPPEQRFPNKEELDARAKIIALMRSLENVPGVWRNIAGDYELYTGHHEQQVVPETSKLNS